MKPVPSLKAQALAWLARREHSTSELQAKLLRAARKGVEARRGAHAAEASADEPIEAPADLLAEVHAEVDAVLAWLHEAGHASDGRFVESRLHQRAPRWGTRRIAQELAQHGLALSPEQSADLKASELDRALAQWRKRFSASPPDLPAADALKAQAKQSRFLLSRGFSPDIVRQVLRAAHAEGSEPGELA